MKPISIGHGVSCDLTRLVATRLLVQAASGAGKSWLIRRLLEQSHGKIQQIVIDPEGEFASLREKFDYVLAARVGGDTLADPRTAALLAERLLTLRVSAILDIYELSPDARVAFVRLFLAALIDAPKTLWHPALIVLDEAQNFAPEKGDAESADAVKALCSRGRKRGFCAVLATQRLSKLAKDAAAECGNKLIGRTTLDVDMQRAGDELGFSKPARLQLRDLDDGEFFAFGPALSRVVTKVHVGGVDTHHPKVGALAAVVPPPSDRIKALLPKLSDLPAEAKAREQNVTELRRELATVRRELTAAKQAAPKVEVKTIERPVLAPGQVAALERIVKTLLSSSGELALAAKGVADALGKVEKAEKFEKVRVEIESWAKNGGKQAEAREGKNTEHSDRADLPPGELAVLTAVVQYPGLDRRRLSVLTGYKKSSRDSYVARLSKRGYVTGGTHLTATRDGQDALGEDFEPLPAGPALVKYWRERLPGGEREIFALLTSGSPNAGYTRQDIQATIGKKKSSVDSYLVRLKARGIVMSAAGGVVGLSNALRESLEI